MLPTMSAVVSENSMLRKVASTRNVGTTGSAVGHSSSTASWGASPSPSGRSRKRLGSGSTGDGVSAMASSLVSFDGAESQLLRASSLTVLLRGFAAAYADSDGSDITYQLSDPVATIDFFISHNWIVQRWKKFVALALFFNINSTMSITIMYTTAVAVAGGFGMLPVVTRSDGETWAPIATLTSMPVFFVVILFYRDVLWAGGLKGRTAFLDKTCIPQADKDLQRIGITKLGAFLHHSRRMVVLYTSENYFRKLWTVYEVAAFLSLHDTDRMMVLPIAKAVEFAVALVCCYIYGVMSFLLWYEGFFSFYMSLVGTVITVLYCRSQRRWLRERRRLVNGVSCFSVRDCECFCEDDRPVVYNNISILMRASEAVDVDATEQQSLDAFDELVRSEVLLRVVGSTSSRLGNYKLNACIGFAISGGILAGFPAIAEDPRHLLVGSLYRLSWVVALWPLAVEWAIFASSFCLDVEGLLEWLWAALVVVVVVAAPFTALHGALSWLAEDARTSDALLGVLLVIVVLGTLLALLVSGGGRTVRPAQPMARTVVMAEDSTSTIGAAAEEDSTKDPVDVVFGTDAQRTFV